jgi:hypothetical protein
MAASVARGMKKNESVRVLMLSTTTAAETTAASCVLAP